MADAMSDEAVRDAVRLPLTTLRAEVERLRDEAHRRSEPDEDDALDGDAEIEAYAYGRVLDLIDKHTREVPL